MSAASSSYPFTVIGLFVIVGVVIQDLTFDFGGLDVNTRLAYYRGVRTALPPVSLGVPVAILLSFAPLIARLFRKRMLLDVMTGLAGVISIYVFVAHLIPMQAALAEVNHADAGNAEQLLAVLGDVGTLHLVVGVLLAGMTVMQVLRHRIEVAEELRKSK